jgi:hypothetical protein
VAKYIFFCPFGYGKIQSKGVFLMLDKQSKKVLKAVNKHIDELGRTNCPAVLEKHLLEYTADEIEKSLWYLDDLDYLSCTSADDTVISISITYQGEKYFEFNRLEFYDFMKQSVITPIIVAALTTLLVNFLTKHF